MKDKPEGNEGREREATRIADRKIDTFDNVKTSDDAHRIETFDNIGKQQDGSIGTFDELKTEKGTADKIVGTDSTGKLERQTPESVEASRMGQAAEDIRKNEFMNPEKWRTLNDSEKRIALDHSGRVLGKAYESPEPPVSIKQMGDPSLQGEFGDGYTYDRSRDVYAGHDQVNPSDYRGHGIVGSDYGIKMNKDGFDSSVNERLLGDDPRVALDTYAHEFRHSYQREQACAFEKGLQSDDAVKSREWSENLKDYVNPPDADLARSDPERYFEKYQAYRNQPVERDANAFGEKLSSRVYGDKEDVGKEDG